MSGSQIGGVVGAVAGVVVGVYTGNWRAVQWGYAIGSAVGGYVDPMKTQGPRLTDAQNQTSTVGGVIPFGYGTYTCAGNIIWTDRLIEHKKTESAGKGSSQKNTTYTYTRSYAIGVSETISAYVWIKKNGKLVYAADPAGLGAAMGWTSKEISDLVASSNKFLQMATLYYGTASQMPDSTIVAVEGVGNVSPFRDLAYIVLENEDLTDTQGAVSQYEFCVFRGAAKSYTTPPYPILDLEAVSPSPYFNKSQSYELPMERVSCNPFFRYATIPQVVNYLVYESPAEDFITITQPFFKSAHIETVVGYVTYEAPAEDAKSITPYFVSASLPVVAGYLSYEDEKTHNISVTPFFNNGSFL